MIARPPTEAEEERIARAKIDRLRLIREEHARRKGISPHDVTLRPDDFERAEREAREDEGGGEPMQRETTTKPPPPAREGTKTDRLIAAARRLAGGDSGEIDRDELYRAIGINRDVRAETQRVSIAICALRKQGRFPWTLAGGLKRGPKPGAYHAPRARTNGEAEPPAPTPKPTRPAPEPEPDEPTPFDPARLARLAAELSGLTRDERAFVRAYLSHTDQ